MRLLDKVLHIMARKLKYPIGIETFSDIIEGGYVYVDKTSYIPMLLDSGKQYFLSRPRRFGKSLFVSTLQAYFEGKRELFKGLDIDKEEELDWTQRPVFKFSLNAVDAHSEDSLTDYLNDSLLLYELKYGRESEIKTLSQRFVYLLMRAYEETGRKAVVLIDEYDAPLLSTLDKMVLNNSYRNTLKAFFSVLKKSDELIHFAFITGISRFSHTSLFSGANHLKDITFYDDFAAICGITEEELHRYMYDSVLEYANKKKITSEKAFEILKENYDGYHFCEDCPDIYNPYSLLSAFSSKKVENFWFRTGTPSYLLEVMKRDNFFLPNLDCMESSQGGLSVKESYLNDPVALLFEAGYATIKSYDDEKMLYKLGLPNKEVSESFSCALLPIYSGYQARDCDDRFYKMRSAVIDGEAERFMELLKTFLEGNPYGNTEMTKRETYFKNNIFLIFKALGFRPRVEEQTCRARMDVMMETRRYVYIFELKTDGKVEEAAGQIEEKGYADPYRHTGKTLIKIAANYTSSLNNIDTWTIECVSPVL